MYTSTDLHILAATAGLSDDQVVSLWGLARLRALREAAAGTAIPDTHLVDKYMLRLIEDAATEIVPTNLRPWVLFDIHLGMWVVKTHEGFSTLTHNIHDYLARRSSSKQERKSA